MLQPLQRAKIAQAFLGSWGVVKTVDVGEHSLAGLLSGLEMRPVYRLFFQVGEETLAPGIVSGFTYTRETLPEPEAREKLFYRLRRVNRPGFCVEF
jgi:hypothetical protein